VLEGLAERYERHHRCVYADGALAAAVTLSARYVADRFLPDKAIDLIDEAGSRARIEAHAARRTALGGPGGNAAAGAAYAELEQVLEAKSLAAREGLFEEAALLRARELELKARLAGAPGEAAAVVPVVTVAHIAAVVAAWTGVPAEALSADERAAVAGLPAALAGRVLGQDAAVEAAARAVARGAAGLRDRARPVATLMFAGPTGVGKTELAKALADAQFGGGSGTGAAAMVRLDMSEYMERHSGEPSRSLCGAFARRNSFIIKSPAHPPTARSRAPRRRAARLRRLRRGREADRSGAPPAALRAPLRRDREGAPGRLQHPPPGRRGRAADRLAGN
jgi:ATP-dependent Clp protease ATP-binding subunit ClpC